MKMEMPRLPKNGMPLREWILPPLFPVIAVVLLWALIIIALPPDRQNFPLNDDWAYSKGAFRTGAWRGNSLLPPTLNAALGPVATVLSRHPDLWRIARGLRLFTVALSLLGILALTICSGGKWGFLRGSQALRRRRWR